MIYFLLSPAGRAPLRASRLHNIHVYATILRPALRNSGTSKYPNLQCTIFTFNSAGQRTAKKLDPNIMITRSCPSSLRSRSCNHSVGPKRSPARLSDNAQLENID